MEPDLRIYLEQPSWAILIKKDDGTLRCHRADEETGHYHEIVPTEVFVRRATESYCLNCAVRQGIVSLDRPQLRPVT